MRVRQRVCRGFILASLILSSAVSTAADFPVKPVRFVLTIGAGGTLDIGARLIAERMGPRLGQPVVVENRPGGGGRVAIQSVLQATRDGYTLLYAGASVPAQSVLFKDPGYDVLKDLVPVSITLDNFSVLAIPASVPAKTLREFVSHAKSNPGKVNYASFGKNQVMLGFESFKRMAGIQMTEIPYPGTPQMLSALLRNDVQLMGGTLDVFKPHPGAVRILAVIAPARLSGLPDVPTVAEEGYPNFIAPGWHGVFAPTGVSAEVMDRVQKEITLALQVPEVRTKIESMGSVAVGSTMSEARQRVTQEAKYWNEIAKAINLQAD